MINMVCPLCKAEIQLHWKGRSCPACSTNCQAFLEELAKATLANADAHENKAKELGIVLRSYAAATNRAELQGLLKKYIRNPKYFDVVLDAAYPE